MMQYKGYFGTAAIDEEAQVIRGQVVNTRDTITFQGATIPEAVLEFRKSVDSYLEFCTQQGIAPDKPFSGKILVRVPAKVHEGLVINAARENTSLNRYITRLLKKGAKAPAPDAKRTSPLVPAIQPQPLATSKSSARKAAAKAKAKGKRAHSASKTRA